MMIEEKKNIRKALLLVLLTVGTVIFLATSGLGVLAKFLNLFSGFRKSGSVSEKINTAPPAPPVLKEITEAVNKTPYEISGKIEAGNTVVIVFNGSEEEIMADIDGNFSTKLNLIKGDNLLYAYTKDPAGQASKKTDEFKIIYDFEVPKIEITSPADGASFYGSKQQTVAIKGTTEVNASLTINDRFVSVKDDGSFSSDFALSDGENNLVIRAKDAAGNETETSLKLNYSP